MRYVLTLIVCVIASIAAAQPISPQDIWVADGDTIAANGKTYQLVGFDAPETGDKAKCSASKFWRGSFEERRCLVPASSFCEPNGDVKAATWHWFAINGGEPRPTFAFPGIWRRYQGR